MMRIAELRNASKVYGRIQALRDVSLSIGTGEVVSLLGPNGAGKTTAVRLLLGLAQPDQGTVTLFGTDPGSFSARARIGAMLQSATLPETLRVRELVALFSSYYPAPCALPDVIRAAGLQGLEDRLFGRLSGGQKQRVLFALGICGNPDLLFLDEPTAGLDAEARRMVWSGIRTFVARGGSVLLTTHYLEEADILSDRIVMLHRGAVVAQGSPGQVKSRAAAKRIRFVTSLDQARIRSIARDAEIEVHGSTIDIVTADAESVVKELLAQDPTLSDLEVSAATLEDALLAIANDQEKACQELAG
jgi:ABC-2 type transport system ATP-binding protein